MINYDEYEQAAKACYAAAEKAGLTQDDADDCDAGENACQECPFSVYAAKTILAVAGKYIGVGSMVSSAKGCLADAVEQYQKGNYEIAHRWALRSIAFSVGKLHPDYIKYDGVFTCR